MPPADLLAKSVPTAATASPTARFWLTTLLVAGPLLMCDVGLLPLIAFVERRGFPLPSGLLSVLLFVVGLMGAQGTILGIALVLGPGGFALRAVVAWGVGLAAIAAWAIGLALAHYDFIETNGWEILGLVCLVPFLALAVQAPLWFVRLTLGWRFTHADEAGERSTSLADFFSVTSLFAVTFGIAKLGRQLMPREPPADFWAVTGIIWLIVAAVSALTLLPVIWLALGRRWWMASVVVAGLAVSVGALTPSFMMVVRYRQPWRWSNDIMEMTAAYSGIAVGILLGLLCWQRFGWRLTMGSTPRSSPAIEQK